MAPSIDDVARAAGVSTATVSRALRGLPNVSLATRERVCEVAAELGYVASPSAASLATGRTRSIGLLTPWVTRWFFAQVIEGAERELRSHGFDALLFTLDEDHGRVRHPVDTRLLRRRVDGILVVGVPMSADEAAGIAGLGRPVVFVGTAPPGQVAVRLDDEGTAAAATRHLLQLGHRRIAHLTGDPADTLPWSPPVLRRAGWRRALAEAGVPAEDAAEVYGSFGVEGGRASMHALLDRAPDVTAVFAASDEMAMGAILAARERGRRVPEDLSVIGIDGHRLGELVGLTTMAQEAFAQGACAAGLLLTLLAGAAVPAETVFRTALVERSSTAPVPATASGTGSLTQARGAG